MANNSRNQSVTVEEFSRRFFFLSTSDVERLENGEELTVEADLGWMDQSANPEWAYLSVADISEVNNLDDVAYMNDEGDYVVDYEDIQETITPCTIAKSVVGELPAGLRTGKTIRAEIGLSYDDDGNRWINVLDILSIEEKDEAEGASFELEPDHEPEEVPEA